MSLEDLGSAGSNLSLVCVIATVFTLTPTAS
jgi:hypothetical protein